MNTQTSTDSVFAAIDTAKQEIASKTARSRQQLAGIRAAMADMEADAKRLEGEIVAGERLGLRALAERILREIEDAPTAEHAPAPPTEFDNALAEMANNSLEQPNESGSVN